MWVSIHGVLCAFLTTTLVITDSFASESAGQKCSRYCKKVSSGSTKFKFKTGSSYKYVYDAKISTYINGTGDDVSMLSISADVELFVTSPCEFILQLHDVKLSENFPKQAVLGISDRNSEFKSALERHPLRFQYNDGIIGELCPADDEIPFALNIKRGVLSAFQNSMKNFYSHETLFERDVTGVCKTHYRVKLIEGYKVLIEKNKDLLNCANHVLESPMTPLLPVSSPQSKTQPLLKSTHKCTQTMTHSDLLEEVFCKEVHLFKPFSNTKNGRSNGVVTEITYKLELSTTVPGAVPPTTEKEINLRTTLLYDHVKKENQLDLASEESIYEILDRLQEYSFDGINSNFLTMFSTLVSQLKTLRYPQLAKVFSKTDKPNVRKFLLDAMPLVSTADSMTVMRDLFKANEITSDEMDTWLTSLAFQKTPTVEMISAMKPLLDDGFHAKAMLGISSLIYSYCTANNNNIKNCSNENEVVEVMKRIEEYISNNCETDVRAYKEAVVVALKSIGNAGVLTKNSFEKLQKCYKMNSNSMDVRLAAVFSLRRVPCDNPLRSSVFSLNADIEQDTELRIASYITAMQCPSKSIIDQVKAILYNEDVSQVTSFLWTHLTNLQETSSKWKMEIKEMLKNEYLQNKFKTDVLKFSRNYEGSLFSDKLNAGVTVDSNIIFTPESYLPRSAAVNLTIDMFGETLNIFELGARLEGFEKTFEDFFGPNGYFKDDSVLKILQNLMQYKPENKTKSALDDNIINNEIMEYSNDFKTNYKLERKLQGLFYGRIFGSELYLKQFEGLSELFSEGYNKDSLASIFNLANVFNNKSIDYTKSMNLLNTNYVISTLVGLPLQLSVNGSATIGLKLQSNNDFENLFKTMSATVSMSIHPSALVEITGTMSVDAMIATSGLKSISKLNTNTKNEFNFSMKNGEIVELSIGVPKDKMVIIDVSSEMFVLQKNTSSLIENSSEVDTEKWDTCSGDRVPTKTGINLCSKLLYSNTTLLDDAPYFPLSGPFYYSLLLEKTDSFSNYYFKSQVQFKERFNGIMLISLHFDTPGSKLNRNFHLAGSMDTLNNSVRISVAAPSLGSYNMSMILNNEYDKKGLSLSLHHNDNEMMNITTSLLMSSSYRSGWYQPSFNAHIYNKRYIDVTGNISYDRGTKYSSNLVVTGLSDKFFILAGDLNLNEDKYNALIKVSSPVIDVKVKGNLKSSSTMINAKAKLQYYLVSRSEFQTVDFSTKLQKHTTGSFSKEKAHLNLQMSSWPQYNLSAVWELRRGNNYFNSNGRIKIGETEWTAKQLFSNVLLNSDHRDFAIKLNLACPNKALDYRAEVQHKINERGILSYALGQLNDKKRFIAKFNYELKTLFKRELTFELSDPWKGVKLDTELEYTKNSSLLTTALLGYGNHSRKNWLSLNSTFNMNQTGNSLKVFAELTKSVDDGNIISVYRTSKPFANLTACYFYRLNENGTNNIYTVTSINYRNDAYIFDLNYTKNSLSHTALLQMSSPGSHLSAALEINNSANNKKLSLDVKSQRHLSFNIWAQSEGGKFIYKNLNSESTNADYDQEAGLSFYWDKSNDENQSIILSVKSNQFHKTAELSIPGHCYNFVLDVMEHESALGITLGWGNDKYSVDKRIQLLTSWVLKYPSKLNLMILLKTPFEGYKKQNFNITAVTRESVFFFKTNAGWQELETSFECGGEIADNELLAFSNIQSTIPSIKDMNFKMKCSLNESVHRATINFKYDNDESYLTGIFMKGDFNSKKYRSGSFELLSPYYDSLTTITGFFRLDEESFNFNTTWAKDKSVVLVLDAQSSGNYSLQLLTPINFLRKISVNAAADTSYSNYQFNIQVNDYSATMAFMNNYENNSLATFLKVTSTYPKINLLFNNTLIKDDSLLLQNVFLIDVASKRYLLWESKGSIGTNFNKLVFRSEFNIPLHKLTVYLFHTDNDTNIETNIPVRDLESKLNIYYNENYGIDMRFNYNSDFIHKNIYLLFTTAGLNIDDIMFDLKHKEETRAFYKTLLILPYNYIIKHDLNFTSDHYEYVLTESLLEIHMGGNFNNINKIHNLNKIKIDDENYLYKITHDMNIVLNGYVNNTIIHLNTIYDYEKNVLKEADLSLDSPWTDPISMKYTLTEDLSSESLKNIKFLMRYNKNKEIKLLAVINNWSLRKDLLVEIETPYYKNILFKSLNNIDNDIKTSKSLLMYDGNEEILIDFKIKQDLLNPLLFIKILTSLNNLNLFYINATYNLLNVDDSTVHFETEVMKRSLLVDGKYLNDDKQVSAKVLMTSNSRGLENVNGEIDILKSSPYSIKINCALNDFIKFYISNMNDKLQNNIDANLLINLNHIQNDYRFNTYLMKNNNCSEMKGLLKFISLENGNSKFKFDSEFNINDKKTSTGYLLFNTPYSGYELISGEINLSFNDNIFDKLTGELLTSEKKIPIINLIVTSNNNYDNRNEIAFNLTTKSDYLYNITGAFFLGNDDDFDIDITLKKEKQEFSELLLFKFLNNDTSTFLSVNGLKDFDSFINITFIISQVEHKIKIYKKEYNILLKTEKVYLHTSCGYEIAPETLKYFYLFNYNDSLFSDGVIGFNEGYSNSRIELSEGNIFNFKKLNIKTTYHFGKYLEEGLYHLYYNMDNYSNFFNVSTIDNSEDVELNVYSSILSFQHLKIKTNIFKEDKSVFTNRKNNINKYMDVNIFNDKNELSANNYSLYIKFEQNEVKAEIFTPFSGYESLVLNLSYDYYHKIMFSVLKNDEKILDMLYHSSAKTDRDKDVAYFQGKMFIKGVKKIELQSSIVMLAERKDLLIDYNCDDYNKFKLNITSQTQFLHILLSMKNFMNKNFNSEVLVDLKSTKKISIVEFTIDKNIKMFEFNAELILLDNLSINTFVKIYSEKLFSVNVFAENLLNVKSNLLLPVEIEYPYNSKFILDTEYNFNQDKKIGFLSIKWKEEEYVINGEALINDKIDNSGLLNLFISSKIFSQMNTVSLNCNYDLGTAEDSSKNLNMQLKMNNEDYFITQVVSESSKKLFVHIILPPLLQFSSFKGILGRYDLSSDKKMAAISIFGKVPLKLDVKYNMNNQRGDFQFNMFASSNEIQNFLNITYDFIKKTEINLELIIDNSKVTNINLLFDKHEYVLAINQPLYTNDYVMIDSFGFLFFLDVNEYSKIILKANNNKDYYELSNKLSRTVYGVSSVSNYIIPNHKIKIQCKIILSENAGILFNLTYNDVKKIDLSLSTNLFSNSDIKTININFYCPCANILFNISSERYKHVELFTMWYKFLSGKNITNELLLNIKCNDKSCKSGKTYFEVTCSEMDPIFFKLNHFISNNNNNIAIDLITELMGAEYNIYGRYLAEDNLNVKNLIFLVNNLNRMSSLFFINGTIGKEDSTSKNIGFLKIKLPEDKNTYELSFKSSLGCSNDSILLKENDKSFDIKLLSYNEGAIHLNETLKIKLDCEKQNFNAVLNIPKLSIENVSVFLKYNLSYITFDISDFNTKLLTSYISWKINDYYNLIIDSNISIKKSDVNLMKYIGGKTIFKLKIDRINQRNYFFFDFESPYKTCEKIYFNYNQLGGFGFNSIFKYKFDNYNNVLNLTCNISPFSDKQANFELVLKNVSRISLNFKKEENGVICITKFYPSENIDYTLYLSSYNDINLSVYQMRRNYSCILNKEFKGYSDKNDLFTDVTNEIFAFNAIMSFIINDEEKNFKGNAEVKLNSKKFIFIESGYDSKNQGLKSNNKNDYDDNLDKELEDLYLTKPCNYKFYLRIFSDKNDDFVKRYEILTSFNSTDSEIINGSVFLMSPDSYYNLLLNINLDSLDLIINLHSSEFNKDFKIGFKNEINVPNETSKLLIYLNDNSILITYKYYNVSYISKIELKMNDILNLNGYVEIQGTLSPYIEHFATYYVNGHKGTITLNVVKGNKHGSSLLRIESDEVEISLITKTSWDVRQPFIELRLSHINLYVTATHSAYIMYDNSDSEMNELVGNIVSPYFDDKFASVTLNKKKYNFLKININDFFILELKKDENSGSIYTRLDSEEHNINYNVLYDIYKRLQTIKVEGNIFLFKINCNYIIDSQITFIVNVSKKYSFEASRFELFLSEDDLVINSDAYLSGRNNEKDFYKFTFKLIERGNFNGKISWKNDDLSNTFEISYEKSLTNTTMNLYFDHLDNKLIAFYMLNDNRLTSFIGNADKSLKRFISLEVAVINYDERKQWFLELNSPILNTVKLIHFNTDVNQNETSKNINFDVYYTVTENTDEFIGVKSKLHVNKFDTKIRPLINCFKHLGSTICVEMKRFAVNGYINTKLPNDNTYKLLMLLSGKEVNQTSFLVSSKFYWGNDLEENKEIIETDYNDIQGNVDSLVFTYKFSELGSEPNHVFDIEKSGKKVAEMTLLNSIDLEKNYYGNFKCLLFINNKYKLDFAVENTKQKYVLLNLQTPFYDENIIFESLYIYNNVANNNVKFLLNLPFYLKPNHFELSMKNDVNIKENKFLSSLNFDCKNYLSFGYETFMKDMSDRSINTGMLIYFDGKTLSTTLFSGKRDENINFLVNIASPFKIFRGAKLDLSLSKNIFEASKALIEFNNKELFSLNLSRNNENNTNLIKIKNSKFVLFIQHYLNFTSGVHVYGKISFGYLINEISVVEVGVKLNKMKTEKNNLFIKTVLPTFNKNCSLEVSYYNIDNNEFEYFGKISNGNNNFGFKLVSQNIKFQKFMISTMYNEIQFIFPSKIIVLNSIEQISEKKSYEEYFSRKCFQLKWGESENDMKKVSGDYSIEKLGNELKRSFIMSHFSLIYDKEYFLSTTGNEIYFKITNLPKTYIESESIEFKTNIKYDDMYTDEDDDSITHLFNVLIELPKLDLYYKLSTNFTTLSVMNKAGIKLEYISNNGQFKYIDIFGKINYFYQDIQLIIDTNKEKLFFGGTVWAKENNYNGLTIKSAINDKRPLKLEVGLNRYNPELEIEFNYGLNKSYHLYVGMPNNHLLKAEISHSMYGLQIDDLTTNIQLNTTRFLSGYFRYSPEIYNNFIETISNEYEEYEYVVNKIFEVVISLNENYKLQLMKMNSEIYNDLLSGIELIVYKTFESILHCYYDLCSLFKKMYYENQYFIQDILSVITYAGDNVVLFICRIWDIVMMLKPFQTIIEGISNNIHIDLLKIKQVGTNIKLIVKKTGEKAKEMFTSMKDLIFEIGTEFEYMNQAIGQKLHSLRKTTFIEIYKLDLYIHDLCYTFIYSVNIQIKEAYLFSIQKMINFVCAVDEYINDVIASINESLSTINELESLIKLLAQYFDWFKNQKLSDYINQFKLFVEDVIELIVEDVQLQFDEYKKFLNATSFAVIGKYGTIESHPIGNYIKKIFGNIYYKTKWFWNNSGISEILKESLHQLFDIDKILERSINIIGEGSSFGLLESSFQVSPDYTSVQFTQELPIDWNSFNTLPNFEQLPDYFFNSFGAFNNFTATLDKYKHYLYDVMSFYTESDILQTSIIPEFGSTAMIFGNYYITFDSVMYDFRDLVQPVNTDKCASYVLASDFLDNKFTIIINYKNKNDGERVKDSLTILTEGHQINVDFRSKLIVDGKRTEMPKIIKESLIIYRDINSFIINSKNGFSINCNMVHDVCKIKLNGWYFGKTGGLLGTYNNEPNDDFSFANGTVVKSVQDFVNSWIIHLNDRICEKNSSDNEIDSKSNLVINNSFHNYTLINIEYCKIYFERKESVFATCFRVVNPEPYLEICSNDMKSAKYDTDSFIALCTTAAAYVEKCSNAGVKLNLPFVCAPCGYGEDYLYPRETLNKYNFSAPKTSDVVFVTEQSSCIHNIKLPDIISKLDVALNYNGFKNNRYAVVTYSHGTASITSKFNNDGPFIKTTDGGIWSSDIESIGKSFKSGLYYPSNSVLSVTDPNLLHKDEEFPPAYKALQFVSTLTFRSLASKIVVLIQCQRCSNSFVNHTYIDMMRVMLNSQITLHVLQHEAIKDLNGKSSKVYGVDIYGAYTGRNINSLTPSLPLLKQVSIPKDLCTPVALETNGTLFSLDRISKKFMDMWVRRVAKIEAPSDCEECNCNQMDDGTSRLNCHKCNDQTTSNVVKEWELITTNLDSNVNDGANSEENDNEIDNVIM
ncbi:uncharacterized protein LOC142322172 [Lycorma delicatula]|uniref:uncharacterized protein LOC142322172 n=1 Tax=Lycorma delicatula TaxID=130591 RepID=UPI003F5101A3